MKRWIGVIVCVSVLCAVSFYTALADSYIIPILVDGQPITLTLTIADSGEVTVTSPISNVVIGNLTPIATKPALRIVAGARSRIEPNALDRMVIEKDEFTGVTFYRDERTQRLSKNYLYPYIGTKNNAAWLRLYINYSNDEWLFVRKYSVLVEGTQLWEITPDWKEFKRDNENRLVWEWVDLLATDKNIEMLQAVALSGKAQIRYHGDTYVYDRTITEEEKDIITTVLAAFEQLGGSVDVHRSN